MLIAICRHIKVGGGRCGSPALRDRRYCYYHEGAHREAPPANLLAALRSEGHEKALRTHHEPRRPEDATAVHRDFIELFQALLERQIDVRRAKLMLRGLRSAAENVRCMEEVMALMRRRTAEVIEA